MMDIEHKWNQTFKHQVVGYLLSILLTLTAFWIAMAGEAPHWVAIATLASLGTIQAVMQLILFMNLGIENKPRWNLLMFTLMVCLVVFIVVGSIWIMYHLNYNMPM